MKITAILSTLAIASAAVATGSLEDQFERFIAEHGKVYSSASEKAARFKVFVQNAARVAQLNLEHPSNTFALNGRFADLTEAELEAIHLTGFRSGMPSGLKAMPIGSGAVSTDYPTSLDYTKECYKNEKGEDYVRDQKQCGSCWAFSTTAAVEGAYCKTHKVVVDLSPQQLVDCDKQQAGCNGASTLTEPLDFAAEHGLCTEKDYEYQAINMKCTKSDEKCKSGIYYAKNVNVLSGHPAADIVKHLNEVGPLSVGVGVGFAFQMYKGGVMRKDMCGKSSPNHAVTIVGYEIETSPESVVPNYVFKIRNSWGPAWGEQGNIRVEWGACQLGVMIAGTEAGDLPVPANTDADADEKPSKFFRF